MRVGKYSIPNMRLHPKLFEGTKTLYENFKSEEATNLLTVAKVLGHKTDKSGGFISKLADLRAYGLMTKRGIKVTDLGKKLTYDPSEEERNKALKETLLNIPLWKELYGRFGRTLPTSNFWVKIAEITGLEAPDAQKVEEIVRNAYLADFRYLKEEKELEGDISDMGVEGKVDASTAISEGVLARFTIKDTGYVDIKDKDTFEIAKAYLKVLAKKLEIVEEEG